MIFRELIKELRAQQRMTLRQFCANYGYDPSNWSKMERGAILPPKSPKTLERWANDLKIEQETEDWNLFMYKAAVARGEIPAEILKDPAVEEKLPFLFMAIAKTNLSEDAMDELTKQVKEKKHSSWKQW